MTTPTLGQQITELERELAVRRRVYPEWIRRGTIKQQLADQRTETLAAAVASLKRLQQLDAQPTLFD